MTTRPCFFPPARNARRSVSGKTRRIPVGTRRIEAYRAGMDQHQDRWTAEGVKGGLIRFYHEIAGVGLVFPRADRPIAVEWAGHAVITLHPIEGDRVRGGG